jgi:hypothetical protein
MILDMPLSPQAEARLDDWIHVRIPQWLWRVQWPLFAAALIGLFAAPHVTEQAVSALAATMFLTYAPAFSLWNIWLARNRQVAFIPALRSDMVREAEEPAAFRAAIFFYWIFLFAFPIAGASIIAGWFF